MEKLLFGRVRAWVLILLIILALPAMVGFGYAVVQRAQGQERYGPLGAVAYNIAVIPDTIRSLLHDPDRMLAHYGGETRFAGEHGWRAGAGAADVTGYLLLSRYDGDARTAVVDLVDLSTRTTAFTWRPDFERLFDSFPPSEEHYDNRPFRADHFRVIHPLAFDNGDLLVKDMYAPMGRFDACGRMKWVVGPVYHHATEPGVDGSIWTVALEDPVTLRRYPPDFAEDALVQLSPEGETLFRKSIPQLLIDNDYRYLLAGMQEEWTRDLLHTNDIQPILEDGTYWKKGDVLISIRNRSTILLYRPSTNEILWSKTGPWSMQHDVDVLGDGQIGVFDNHVDHLHFGNIVIGSNRIMTYDFATGETAPLHAEAFEELDIRTVSEGLFTVMPDGGILVEESNYGRIVVFDREANPALQYVNAASDGKPYKLGWARYMTRAEGDEVLAGVRAQSCPAE